MTIYFLFFIIIVVFFYSNTLEGMENQTPPAAKPLAAKPPVTLSLSDAAAIEAKMNQINDIMDQLITKGKNLNAVLGGETDEN